MRAKSYSEIRKPILRWLCLFFLLLVAQASVYAGTVRGKLVRQDGSGKSYAAAYVKVRLNNRKIGQSSFAYSGTDGMYYLYNVPPGEYTLEIWLGSDKRRTYTIRVLDQSYTDIAPISIP